MELYAKGFENWKESMERFVLSIISILKSKRKYHLVDGNASVVRYLTSQTVRQLRAQSPISISINEIGSIHLFVQRLFDFYGEVCNGIPMKDGNISLFAEYFSCHIAPLVLEYAESVKRQNTSGKAKHDLADS